MIFWTLYSLGAVLSAVQIFFAVTRDTHDQSRDQTYISAALILCCLLVGVPFLNLFGGIILWVARRSVDDSLFYGIPYRDPNTHSALARDEKYVGVRRTFRDMPKRRVDSDNVTTLPRAGEPGGKPMSEYPASSGGGCGCTFSDGTVRSKHKSIRHCVAEILCRSRC